MRVSLVVPDKCKGGAEINRTMAQSSRPLRGLHICLGWIFICRINVVSEDAWIANATIAKDNTRISKQEGKKGKP